MTGPVTITLSAEDAAWLGDFLANADFDFDMKWDFAGADTVKRITAQIECARAGGGE